MIVGNCLYIVGITSFRRHTVFILFSFFLFACARMIFALHLKL